MSVQIPATLLNRTVTITRPALPTTKNVSGIIGANTTVSAVAKIRIYQNDDFGSRTGDIEEQGIVSASSHKGVTSAAENIKAGDTVVDNSTSEEFNVNLVDSMPGGHSGSHKEVWLTSSEYL